MASKTNRSLQVKYKKSLVQRQASAEAEFSKPAYYTDKRALRDIAASAQHMVVPAKREITTCTDRTTVLYNPSIHRKPLPLALRCAVACDSELVKRADYLAR